MSNEAKRADDVVPRDQALAAFLRQGERRPLDAHAAKDHLASLRVLQTCGFVVTGDDEEYSHARGHEVAEYILTLSDTP